MKNLNVTYNKVVTVIETSIFTVGSEIKEGSSKVFDFKTKSSFYDWASNEEAMNVIISQNIKSFVNKMNSLGFDTVIDNSFGSKERKSIYCSK